jgi:hypothetical protein
LQICKQGCTFGVHKLNFISMENLPILDCDFFEKAEACYDPATVLGEDWNGTAIDILDHPQVPSEDKIWAVCAKGALPESVQRLMAVAFVRETPLHDGRNVIDLSTDERSLKALEVAELHALGRATDGELDAARDAARDAAGSAAWAATIAAAWNAAWNAARAAARDAAWAATLDAAWDDSSAAARDAQVEIARRVILPGHAA